jgi:hypothetical protein
MSTEENLANDVSLSQSAGTGRPITAEAVDRLIEQAEYKQHRYGQVWHRFDLPLFQGLVGDIDRRGLDQEILLYQGMILEGWTRYLACLATGTQPRFVEFRGTDLEAAERVHVSGIRRQSRPEQRYASFLLLCEACPAFGAKYEAMRQQGAQQQEAGTPLSTGGQRVDVLGAKAAFVGVGRSTAANVEDAKRRNPGAVARIAKGETTANQELGKTKGKAPPAAKPPGASESRRPDKGADKNVEQRTKEPEVRAGDLIYEVGPYSSRVADSPRIIEHEVRRVNTDSYICADGTRLRKLLAFSLSEAKAHRISLIGVEKVSREAAIEHLEEVLKQEPTIVPAKKKQSDGK